MCSICYGHHGRPMAGMARLTGTCAAFEAKMVTAKHVVVVADSIAIEIMIIVVIVVWSS